MTATPRRTDERGLSSLAETVAYRLSIFEAIKRGILCPFEAKVAQIGYSLKGLRKSGDGWKDKEVDELMTAANALDVIVQKWIEEAYGRPTVAFTATVGQAQRLAEKFREAGIPADCVSGETEKEERRRILSDYDAGRLRVVTTCNVLTEGWDAPATSCVIMARPTTSGVLFVQALGRGLRTYPEKESCLILQFVPMEAPIDLFMVGDLLGKPKKQQKAEKKALDAGVILDAFGVDVNGDVGGWEADPDKVVMEATELFAKGKNRNLAWTLDPATGIVTLSTDFKSAIGIVPPDPAYVEALSEECRFPMWRDFVAQRAKFRLCRMRDNKHLAVEGHFDTLEEAEQAARSLLSKKTMWGKSRNADWRKKPASMRRKLLAMRLGVWRDGMTDGECHQAVAHKFFTDLVEKEKRNSGVLSIPLRFADRVLSGWR